MSGRPFKVRPAAAKANKDGPFQATISEQHLKDFGGQNQSNGWVLGKKRPVPVLFWREVPQKGQHAQTAVGRVVLLSDTVRQLAGLSLGDDVQLVPEADAPKQAGSVTLLELAPGSTEDEGIERADLLNEAKEVLWQSNFVACGQEIQLKSRRLSVHKINSSQEGCLYQSTEDMDVRLEPSVPPRLPMRISRKNIFGAEHVLDHLDGALKFFNEERTAKRDPTEPDSSFFLLTGPGQCGKTLLMQAVARMSWPKVIQVKLGRKTMTNVSNALERGRQLGRALIIIDEIDIANLEKHEHQELSRIILEHKQKLDSDRSCRILLLAGIRNVDEIDERLLEPGGFDRVFRIGLPNTKTREAILRNLFRDIVNNERFISELARRTPAYSGGELGQLRKEVGRSWNRDPSPARVEDTDRFLSYATASLEIVKPTTMRGLQIEVPDTRFSDIGGQLELKKLLQKSLRHAISNGESIAKKGLRPAKGLLMYGPPGCSKTLAAKAVATEAGINFLLVNAGELIGSYLGESEKRIRELFRRARDASPCVIFFDEFETVGADRKHAHKGLNVVQTLLTELDGVKPLQGVFVLAATNEPELLDPALMRPGRLNPHVMVGLPDAEARREIIQIKLRRIDAARINRKDLQTDSYVEATEGLTGAEVIAFVESALYRWDDEEEETNSDLQLRHSHFEAAVAGIKPSVSADQLKRYQDWGFRNAN